MQWTGYSPVPDSDNWRQIDYKYDVYGRRSEKKVDGYGTRYLYDGPQVIAEYDGNNNLLRKYIYGKCRVTSVFTTYSCSKFRNAYPDRP